MQQSSTPLTTLIQRRQNLAEKIETPIVLWSGATSPRNFPANVYPFRASSHFLYFAGLSLPNAVIRLESGHLELFLDKPSQGSVLWHGESPGPEAIAEQIGAERVWPLSALDDRSQGAATIPVQDWQTRQHQFQVLNRDLGETTELDQALIEAVIQSRLCHDAAALTEIRQAVEVTVAAHQAGMVATKIGQRESQVRAAMEQVIMAHNMTCAYGSIVTVHGEVLHNDRYCHVLQPGDLLLADVGAETEGGWAADVTRTWPVSGRFSATQRAIYEVVLQAHDRCIAAIHPGVEYRDIHLLACEVLAEGLVDLGILKGQPQDLVAQDAHSLFFPHGVGHLLGLDVHDMEDLGDRAGYAPGRTRSDRFGLCFLRLDRLLQAGMVVTIEPGFYQVPGILNDPRRRDRYQDQVDWERLAEFADVRGIRIEDDVWVTEVESQVLTEALPTTVEAIEILAS
jgi:Xaa-Pro aminopeptidase/Xaa-Pro dipeptidase